MTAPTLADLYWCITDHTDSHSVHEQADITLPGLNGLSLTVAALVNDTLNRPAVMVAGVELSADTVDELIAILSDRNALSRKAVEDRAVTR